MFHLSIYAFWQVCNNYCHLLIKDKSTAHVIHPQTMRSVHWIVIIRMHLATEELTLAQSISLCNKTPALQGKLQKCRDFTASVQQGHECRSKWSAIIDSITIQHFNVVNLHHVNDTLKAADSAGVKSRRPGMKIQFLHGRIRNRHSVFVSRNV